MLDNLPAFKLIPEPAGFGVQVDDNVLRTTPERGRTRQRKIAETDRALLPVTFLLKGDALNYFYAWYRTYQVERFQIRLKIRGAVLSWYEVQFVSGLDEQLISPKHWRTGVTLEAVLSSADPETDQALILIYDASEGNPTRYLQLLKQLANDDLPSA